MDGVRHLVCPVLVGRDDLLDLAGRRIAEVVRGEGRFVLFAGEAGVGKSRLLGAVERRAAAEGLRTVRAGAYPSDLRVPGAILVDLARSLTRLPTGAATGVALAARLDDDAVADARGGDPTRRRRGLVLDLADLLAALPEAGPIAVSLEDLHWADDLTLEVVEALVRRIPEMPLLLLATYRSDELYPRVPMRAWRARLVGRRQAEEARLRRLDESETARMTTLLVGSSVPASREVAGAVHARTDGIPLHVEELLAAVGPGATIDRAAVRDAEVPGTVEDAVLSRMADRSGPAVRVARAAAVVGRAMDLDVLCTVSDISDAEISAPLAELADHFLLLRSGPHGRYGFRHALIGDAIYASIPEPERRGLHGRAADALIARGASRSGAILAFHAERAGRTDEAFAAARSAADSARSISSHTEARELYALALRTAPRDLAPAETAAILEAYGRAAAATDENAAAADAFAAAREAYLEAGDGLAAAAVVGPLVAAQHLLGDDLDSRVARLTGALAEVPPGDIGTAAAATVRARLLADLATAYMLDRRLEDGIGYGIEARDLAARVGDRATVHDASTTIGVFDVFSGRMDAGWSTLETTLADAHADHDEAQSARAYRMLGSCASVLVEYERGERWLREGIAEAERNELWNHRHYMAAHLAHVAWATGRWDEADDLARHALADGRGGVTTRVTALHVIGFVALGRGRLDAATEALEDARGLGARMRELQRLSPALWGLAEVALARDDPATASALAEEGRAASAIVADAAYLFPWVVTGTRAHLAAGDPAAARHWLESVEAPIRHRAIPGTLPALEHAVGLVALAEGGTRRARTALRAAADGWAARRRTWEATWALIDLARAHARANRPSEAGRLAAEAHARAARLGAPGIVAAATALARAAPRGGEPDPWSPLTAREWEVAGRIAAGATNVEIAEALGISRKTVAAHVEHILAKLGIGRRTEIAAWASTRDAVGAVLHSRPHGDDREE